MAAQHTVAAGKSEHVDLAHDVIQVRWHMAQAWAFVGQPGCAPLYGPSPASRVPAASEANNIHPRQTHNMCRFAAKPWPGKSHWHEALHLA